MLASLLVLVALFENWNFPIIVEQLLYNLKQLFILPAACAYAYVFGVILTINSDYFPKLS